MALAGADRVEGANAKNANNAAEYVGLLKVQIKQFLGARSSTKSMALFR
jgi:hypothetical protein